MFSISSNAASGIKIQYLHLQENKGIVHIVLGELIKSIQTA